MMKLGIIIYSNDSETVWNAFRLSSFSLKKGDEVKVFLLGKGVESETLDTHKFNVSAEMKQFIEAGGEIYACGICLKLRALEETEICPVSTLFDLHKIISESDKILTF